jgi:hypothetical protein
MMKDETNQVELTTTEAENITTTQGMNAEDEPEDKAEEGYTIDHALAELGSACGPFQMIHCLACIMMFNGSQFFYSIPFY